MPRELTLVADGPYEKLIRVVSEVSRSLDEPTGLRRGLECAAEAVGAEVAALLRSRSVLAAVRVPPGPVPEADVLLALADLPAGPVVLPGGDAYRTAVVPIGNAAGKLLVIRSGDTPLHEPGHRIADGDGRSPHPGRPDDGGCRWRSRIAVRAPPAAREADEDPTGMGGSGLAGGSPRCGHRRSRRAPWRRGRGIGASHRSRRSIVLDHVVHQRGRGTTFTVRLPVGSAPRERVQEIGVV